MHWAADSTHRDLRVSERHMRGGDRSLIGEQRISMAAAAKNPIASQIQNHPAHGPVLAHDRGRVLRCAARVLPVLPVVR